MASANVTNTKVVPQKTTVFPYYDDFNEDKNFYRLLFRPSRAVQARELTQVQTYAQSQTERLGRHIFENGSIVQGGIIQYDIATSINLVSQYANTDINISDFIGQKISLSTNDDSIQYQVISGENADTSNPPVLLAKNLTASSFANDSTIKTSSNVYANLASSNVYGVGITAFLPDSIFFMNGFFVRVPQQTIVVSRYNPNANVRVGIEFTEEIITNDTDTSLLDPALETSNYQAPGADRLKINAVLSTRTLDSIDDEAFIELLRLKNGERDAYVKIPIYSEIEETFARRTYDESGNYTVRPFNLQLKQSSNSSNIIGRLDPGKAYIFGYEFETIAPFDIEIPRPLETSNYSAFDISTAYGNYVLTSNMQGLFDISTMPTVDIHNVPYPFINNANTNTYNSTKIGTARIRNILFDDSIVASNGKTHIHRAYIFDTRFNPLTGNATGGTSNTIVLDRSNISANGHAYNGMYIRITNGPGTGDFKQIISYNSTSKTAIVSSDFSSIPTTSTQFSIEGSFKDAESLVISGIANTNISTDSKTNNTPNGDTILSETGYNKMYFVLPKNYTKPGIGLNNYQYRKIFTSRTFTNGVGTITVPAGEALIGSGNLSDTIKLNNYLVIVKDKQTSSNVSNGEILSFTSPRSISVSGSTSTLDTNLTSDTFTADIIADVMINTGNETSAKSKSLIFANTTHASSETANAVLDTGSSNTSVFLNSGQVWIRNPNKIPNQGDSLFVSDVKNIKKIYDLKGTNVTSGIDLSIFADVTKNYILDTGQYDNYYDHAMIHLKSGVPSPKGPIVVCFDYYQHSSGLSDGKGFFNVDSYPNVNTPNGYADIPVYISEAGQAIQLRDVIDFRPVRQNASNNSPDFTLNGIRIPTPNEEITVNFDYYKARRDLIVLSKERRFQHIMGISSELPTYPVIPSDSMALYKLDLPPYIVSFANVKINFIENKRYTMRDIGKIDERLSHIEYYTALSLLEKNAKDMVIRDSDGLERSKYGIIVDKFMGHQIGDVSNQDYICSMDVAKGELRPAAEKIDIKLLKTTGSNYSQNSQLITVSYDSVPLIVQDKASKPVNLQPYAIANYKGIAKLIPDTDYWIDTEVSAEVATNAVGTRDNWTTLSGNSAGSITTFTDQIRNIGDISTVNPLGNSVSPTRTMIGDSIQDPFRSEWNDWSNRWFQGSSEGIRPPGQISDSTSWIGRNADTTIITDQNTPSVSQDPSTITVNVNENVIDISVIPFIRAKEILFKVSGMRPNANIWTFFDQTNVDRFISRANKITLNGSHNFNDTPYINEIISTGSNTSTIILTSRDANDTVLYVANTNGEFIPGQVITGSISGITATIKSVEHYSGKAASSLGNTSNIQLQIGSSDVTNYYTGNVIYLLSGEGAGSFANIVSYNSATRIVSVDSSFSQAPTTNTKYSIGRTKVNRKGEFAGSFFIPQGEFRVGERMLNFIDSEKNQVGFISSSAESVYLSHGLIQQKSRDIVSILPPEIIPLPPTPNTRTPWIVPEPDIGGEAASSCAGTVGFDESGTPVGCWHEPDPIAQTILIDRIYADGIFLDSIDVCFRRKDSILPVRIELRPVVNGYPHAGLILPGTQVSVSSENVNITETPNFDNSSNYTRFKFNNPVYLLPKTEYAIVLISDSLDYEAWVAEMGQNHIGTERIISEQPYVGSFFRSQNQRTWTAYQYEDLMFRANRCSFSLNPAIVYFRNEHPKANKAMDWMYLNSNEMKPDSTFIKYEVKALNENSLILDSSYNQIESQRNYRHNERKAILNVNESTNVRVTIQTTNEYVSPVLDVSRFSFLAIRNIISNGGISNNMITLSNYGFNYSNSANISITISGGSEGETANAYVANTLTGNINTIIMDAYGSKYTGRANISFNTNDAGVIVPASATIASELNASGGPAFARYITRKVTLNDGFDAGDLRVFLTAYRPIGTDVHVYAKVLSSDDPTTFESQEYIKLVPTRASNQYSENDDDYIEYEYRPSLTSNTIAYSSSTGTYNSFRTFSVKIVMFSESTIVVPIIKDFRAIALPGSD